MTIQFHPRHQKGGVKQRFLFLELVELLAIYNSTVDFYLILIYCFALNGYRVGKFKVDLFLLVIAVFVFFAVFNASMRGPMLRSKDRANFGFDSFLFFKLQCVLHVNLLKGAPIL